MYPLNSLQFYMSIIPQASWRKTFACDRQKKKKKDLADSDLVTLRKSSVISGPHLIQISRTDWQSLLPFRTIQEVNQDFLI